MSAVSEQQREDGGAGEPGADTRVGARASGGRMHLLCELGRHKPAPGARRSQGYCFTRCERCGSDLVRRDEGQWFVPRGYRVGWHREPPEGAKPVSILEELEPPRTGGRKPALFGAVREAPSYLGLRRRPEPGIELAIQEVLRDLNDRDREQQDAAPNMIAETASSAIDEDFMQDEPEYPWGEDAAFATVPIPAPPEPAPAEPEDEPVPVSPQQADSPGDDAPREDPAPVAEAEPAKAEAAVPQDTAVPQDSAVPQESAVPQAPAVPQEDAEAEARPGLLTRLSARLAAVSAERIPWATIVVGTVTLVSVAAFLLILSFVTRREQPVPPAPTQQADSARPMPQFVTARLLRCRSAPARQARPVRTFRRGTRVDRLALDGDWASISHRGRQCWVSARYLSGERPL